MNVSFLTTDKYKYLDFYFLALLSYYHDSEAATRHNLHMIILFGQILKNAEVIYRDEAGFKLGYEDFIETNINGTLRKFYCKKL